MRGMDSSSRIYAVAKEAWKDDDDVFFVNILYIYVYLLMSGLKVL